jgi:hypothetical protein
VSPRGVLGWAAVLLLPGWALWVAATSPLLEWRDPVYVAAGVAGVAGLCLMLAQPLLIAGLLPGLCGRRGRVLHRATGALLVAAVILHVAGLWATSPPDVIDALTFTSPAPFSGWGVIAMWAAFAAAGLAVARGRVGLRVFRRAHAALVVLAVLGTVVHAWLIVGTMGAASKAALSAAVLAATAWAIATRGIWRRVR